MILASTSITLAKISDGEQGRGVTSIIGEYALSTSNTEVTGTWTTDVSSLTLSPTNKFLWYRETTNYTSGDPLVVSPYIIGVYGDTGGTGAKGDKGDSIVAQYSYSTSPSEPTATTLAWTTLDIYWGEEQGVWNWWTDTQLEEIEGLYIWLRTKVGEGDWVYTRLTGVQGQTGDTGNGIESVVNYYLKTSLDSGVTKETEGWSETIQTVTPTEKYLWNYETINYTDGTSSDSTPCIIGVYGEKGDTGNGIADITEYYQVSDSNTVAPSTWVSPPAEIPPMTANNRFLWNYEVITYTDGTTKETIKRVIGAYGEKGTPALVCSISCDKSAVVRNDRLTTSATYTFTADVQGYSGTVGMTINGTDVTLTQSGTKYLYAYVMAYKNASSITASVSIDGTVMDTITLGVVDETKHTIYFGVYEQNPTPEEGQTFIQGDCYFNATDNCVYAYGTHEGATGWYLISAFSESELGYEERGTILAKAMSDALGTIEPSSVTSSDYAYFNNLIVGLITAEYIQTQKLKLTQDGVISSSEVSTDKSEDVDTQGFLTKEGFRLEDTGALRANQLYLGISTEEGNKIIFDNNSIRCVNSSGSVLWQLNPDGTANFNSEITANKLTAVGNNNKISATSLDCDALTTVDEKAGKTFSESFTPELYATSDALAWIISQYLNNTIPVSETAFASTGWTYNSKTINHVALGIYYITETIEDEFAEGTPLVLGKKYYNWKTINAGDGKLVIKRMINAYNFPIWVYADVNLGGILNGINSTFIFEDGTTKYGHSTDEDVWVCLMPNQGIDVYASSWAWWGSQRANASLYVYPSFKNLCFVNNPVELTSLRNVKFQGSSSLKRATICSIPLPTGHPTVIVLALNVRTEGTDGYYGLNSVKSNHCPVSFKTTIGSTTQYLTARLVLDDHNVQKWNITVPSNATSIQLEKELYYTETKTYDNGNTATIINYIYVTVKRIVYAIAYNDEDHTALIRYDDSSLQYLGTKRSYVQGSFGGIVDSTGSDIIPTQYYASSSVYNQIVTSLGFASYGEYNVNYTTITINGTSYTNFTRMRITSESIAFGTSVQDIITIYSTGSNTAGKGSANDGGYTGTVYSGISADIVTIATDTGVFTGSLYPKTADVNDIGKSNLKYNVLYVNRVNATEVYGAVFN